MTVILAAVTLTLLMTTTLLPIARSSISKKTRQAEEALFLAKLQIVREHYPQLKRFTYREIVERFDIESIYNQIGRR